MRIHAPFVKYNMLMIASMMRCENMLGQMHEGQQVEAMEDDGACHGATLGHADMQT